MPLILNHETKLDPGSPTVRKASKVDVPQKAPHPLAGSPLCFQTCKTLMAFSGVGVGMLGYSKGGLKQDFQPCF